MTLKAKACRLHRRVSARMHPQWTVMPREYGSRLTFRPLVGHWLCAKLRNHGSGGCEHTATAPSTPLVFWAMLATTNSLSHSEPVPLTFSTLYFLAAMFVQCPRGSGAWLFDRTTHYACETELSSTLFASPLSFRDPTQSDQRFDFSFFACQGLRFSEMDR